MKGWWVLVVVCTDNHQHQPTLNRSFSNRQPPTPTNPPATLVRTLFGFGALVRKYFRLDDPFKFFLTKYTSQFFTWAPHLQPHYDCSLQLIFFHWI